MRSIINIYIACSQNKRELKFEANNFRNKYYNDLEILLFSKGRKHSCINEVLEVSKYYRDIKKEYDLN